MVVGLSIVISVVWLQYMILDVRRDGYSVYIIRVVFIQYA